MIASKGVIAFAVFFGTLLLALGIVSALTGCDGPYDGANTVQVHNEPGPSYYMHDMRLKDGTRCVVSTSSNEQGGTGVTCDWDKRGQYGQALEHP